MLRTTPKPTVGDLLRSFRQRRGMSQLSLATRAEISQRHLSFMESGRALPSREMVLKLAKHLDVPPRERNELLAAAGFAPIAQQRPLSDPRLAAARMAVDLVLAGHEPFPALAIDRYWTLLNANRAALRLLSGIPSALLAPPCNVLRLSLHPEGLAPRIENLATWRDHVLARLGRQVEVSGDPRLAELLHELERFPVPASSHEPEDDGFADVAVPLRLRTPYGVLSFLSTTTVFGTPVDVTLNELAIEAFLPADAHTLEALRTASAGS